jgi:hypothetical protein
LVAVVAPLSAANKEAALESTARLQQREWRPSRQSAVAVVADMESTAETVDVVVAKVENLALTA